MGQLDSGYTTPSNMTNASVNTQETSACSSSASSTGSSTPTNPGATPPSTSPNNVMLNSGSYSDPALPHPPPNIMSGQQHFTTMPRHYMNNQRQMPQMAVMSTTGGTLQKVKRVYI